jgi:hypothetical protein
MRESYQSGEREPFIESFIPLDKSWLIRLGVLDLLNGYDDISRALATRNEPLGEDVAALIRVSEQWRDSEPLDVGESGTLYRFLRFAAWQRDEDREFIKRGTLLNRPLCDNPAIIHWPLERLLTLDGGTSQWASAAVLCGNQDPVPHNCPFKLQVTYDALTHWHMRRQREQAVEMPLDLTIARQAMAYIRWRSTGEMDFVPLQAEDYCFARAFDVITADEGAARWPELAGHESNRLLSMEMALVEPLVASADHRVIQAVAMRRVLDVAFTQPDAVSKSWPRFWDFMSYVELQSAS